MAGSVFLLTEPVRFDAIGGGLVQMRMVSGEEVITCAMSAAQAMATGHAGRAFMEQWHRDHAPHVEPIGKGRRAKH